ncbi:MULTISPECIES: MBOAT family O-acyltransferase [unclassified Clostridium]|uniref:MBOAT family O-acyltransferase n=1 Tax=unclassified Clostridium TaxID=2614128 RepID=UPI001106546C|nr:MULTISPECIES: MBOAT family O-acyltransferase [unclassified Clostridium]
MVFSSLEFIFRFLPAFLFIYYIIPGKGKNLWLLMGSLGFYFYGVRDTPFYFVLLILSILVNYRIGILIGRRRIGRFRRRWLIYGVIYNLFWLILFKYCGFLVQNLNLMLSLARIPAELPVIAPVLPVGISFYTFQAISYLADVYRKTVPYERSLVGFGMYISMFPQLIAGPIVTYSSVRRQIGFRRITFQSIEDGLRDFTIGLGFKVLLANRIGGLWNEVQAIGYDSISTPMAWLGLAAFSLQIYFDFCGYSLMAKGLGSLMGFQLPDNFHQPYMSLSMTEFWRRWHMTLGSWFREYVYIPLGGNRCGTFLTFRNLFAVWILTGFWHGASWNFIVWGLLLFLIISVERLGLLRILERWKVIGHLYMLCMIPLTWLVFAVTDMKQTALYVQRLFPFLQNLFPFHQEQCFYFSGDYMKYGRLYAFSLAAGLLFMTGIPMRFYARFRYSMVTAAGLLAVFWLCVYCMHMGMDDPFLYFRF